MKNPEQFPAITVIALLLTLSGCASSGGSTESTGYTTVATDDPGINSDTLRVAGSEASPADTVTTAAGDTLSAPDDVDAPTTITGSTEAASRNRFEPNVIEVNGDASIKLDDYLRTVAGVRVLGQREHSQINIRGVTSLRGGNSPLFIIDGMRFGRNFSEVYFYVNLSEVKEIRIIKGTETAFYGSEGAAGVILINRYSARDPRP